MLDPRFISISITQAIPWLGKIPSYRETERARWLFEERDPRSETGEDELVRAGGLSLADVPNFAVSLLV
jgi:hypothetical protein